MPVIFCGIPVVTTKKLVSGRQSFNEAIKKLAPAIEEARKNGHYGVQEIAGYSNDHGFMAPNGRRFTYTTLHRILERLERAGPDKRTQIGPRRGIGAALPATAGQEFKCIGPCLHPARASRRAERLAHTRLETRRSECVDAHSPQSLSAAGRSLMLNIQPTKEEIHVGKLLKQVRIAKELGQLKKFRHWAGATSNSFDAKLAAVQRANRHRKLSDRLDTASVRRSPMALTLGRVPTNPCSCTVSGRLQNPISFVLTWRSELKTERFNIYSFRCLNRSQTLLPTNTVKNGGTHAAIKHVVRP